VERPIPTCNAYECYLRRAGRSSGSPEPALDKAMEYLEEGLRVLPGQPRSSWQAWLRAFHWMQLGVGQERQPREGEAFAARAWTLAPDLPQEHLVLGADGHHRHGNNQALSPPRASAAAGRTTGMRWRGQERYSRLWEDL